MDYSKLSDCDIAHMVSQKLPGRYITYADHVMDSETEETFDPCNNAADAWPIIVANRIALTPYGSDAVFWEAEDRYGTGKSDCDNSPLRAAMIVYLMMQEG